MSTVLHAARVRVPYEPSRPRFRGVDRAISWVSHHENEKIVVLAHLSRKAPRQLARARVAQMYTYSASASRSTSRNSRHPVSAPPEVPYTFAVLQKQKARQWQPQILSVGLAKVTL